MIILITLIVKTVNDLSYVNCINYYDLITENSLRYETLNTICKNFEAEDFHLSPMLKVKVKMKDEEEWDNVNPDDAVVYYILTHPEVDDKYDDVRHNADILEKYFDKLNNLPPYRTEDDLKFLGCSDVKIEKFNEYEKEYCKELLKEVNFYKIAHRKEVQVRALCQVTKDKAETIDRVSYRWDEFLKLYVKAFHHDI